MAPKKDKGKEPPPPPKATTLYKARDPLPAANPPEQEELEEVAKASRIELPSVLPVWDEEAVKGIAWHPQAETPYSDSSFDVRALPWTVMQHVAGWKRAWRIADEEAPMETEPVLTLAPAPEPELPAAPEGDKKAGKADGKAKAEAKAKAKPEPKAKAKAAAAAAETKPTVAEQFGERSSEYFVVTQAEFRSRQFELTDDDSMSPLCQSISAQIGLIGEQKKFIPKGYFLWELIHPQDEHAQPYYNPGGKYVVKLFVQGSWRQVVIDDVVPVGNATLSGQVAPILPATPLANVLWPQLLTKALLRTFQADLSLASLNVVTALTGWMPFQFPLTWLNLQTCCQMRSFACVQIMSEINVAGRQKEIMPGAEPGVRQRVSDAGRGGEDPMGPLEEQVMTQKLASPPGVSFLSFLLCELEEEPKQLRLKALSWLPRGGSIRKTVLDVGESDLDDEEDEDLAKMDDRSFTETAVDDDEEDEERRLMRSPGGEDGPDSSRRDEDAEGEGEERSVEASMAEFVPPWPEADPAPLLMKSVMTEFRTELLGGYWVNFEALLTEGNPLNHADKQRMLLYTPRNEGLLARLSTLREETTEADETQGAAAGAPRGGHRHPPVSLLRLRLQPRIFEDKDIKGNSGSLAATLEDTADLALLKPAPGPPWHRVAILYEPVAATVPPDPEGTTPAAPSQPKVSRCLLQCVNDWQPADIEKPEYPSPSAVQMSVGEGTGPSATRTMLLPSGEHWFLTFDDAPASTLTVQVDGSMLKAEQSLVSFTEPTQVMKEQGLPVASLEALEFAAQQGFKVWAKAELSLSASAAESATAVQLLSDISDPSLRANLQLMFIKVADPGTADDPDSHGSPKLVHMCSTVLLPVVSLPLGSLETDGMQLRHTYIVLLCATLPTLVMPGVVSLHAALLAPLERSLSPTSAEAEEETFEPPDTPLSFDLLDSSHMLRWSAATSPNEKGIVLRERLVIPEGVEASAVTASMRVSVVGLPGAYLRASLIAQLAPEPGAAEEAAPMQGTGSQTLAAANAAAAEAKRLPEPKAYGGRFKWLERCQQIEEQTGPEVAFFPHILLRAGMIYILDVRVDPHRGPDSLEGGEWLLELFASGPVESGADTMEQDLEELVRQSWEEGQNPALPPRKERAAAARKKWLISKGLMEAEPVEEAPPPPTPAKETKPAAKAKAEGKAAKGKAAEPPPEPVETPEEIAAREQAELDKARQRATNLLHCNEPLRDFLIRHTDATDAVLVEEDPYTIDSISPMLETSTGSYYPLSVSSLAEARQAEITTSADIHSQLQQDMQSAKEGNTEAMTRLASEWRAAEGGDQLPDASSRAAALTEQRESLRVGLQNRVQKRTELKEATCDPEKLDVAALQTLIQEAEDTNVAEWDAPLVQAAKAKVTIIEGSESAKSLLAAQASEEVPPLLNPDARESFSQLLDSLRESYEVLNAQKVPLPEQLLGTELLAQGQEALQAAVAAAAADAE